MAIQERSRAGQICTAACLAVLVMGGAGGAAPRSRTVIQLFEARPVSTSPVVGPQLPLDQGVVFDQVLLLMGCSGRPTAVISSTPDGAGSLVTDNVIAVNGQNVCTGQESEGGRSCFNGFAGSLGDPALAAYGAVAPLDVHHLMPTGKKQVVTFHLTDAGGLLANSDLWLVTNCIVHNKVELCHKPGTPAEHAIEVAQSSVPAHLRHGDYIGPCS